MSLLLFLLLSLSRISSSADNNYTYTKLSFPVNNEDSNSFGYKTFENDNDVTIASICLDDDYIYLLDQFHSNVKKINISNKNIETSKKISDLKYPWLLDIIIFNNKIYVTNTLRSIFVLDKKMNHIRTIESKERGKDTL
jgi:hypothetical protein